jgi:hypothetical protein
VPVVSNAAEQDAVGDAPPPARAPVVQIVVAPSLIATVPLGVFVPLVRVTVAVKVTDWPVTEGLVAEATVVVVVTVAACTTNVTLPLVTEVLLLQPPPVVSVALTWNVYVPATVAPVVATVIRLLKVPLLFAEIGFGLNDAVAPEGSPMALNVEAQVPPPPENTTFTEPAAFGPYWVEPPAMTGLVC